MAHGAEHRAQSALYLYHFLYRMSIFHWRSFGCLLKLPT